MSTSISKPANAIGIRFKHEDTAPVCGPVWFITDEGDHVPVFSDHLDFLGNPAAGWMTLAETKKMAKHFALKVEQV